LNVGDKLGDLVGFEVLGDEVGLAVVGTKEGRNVTDGEKLGDIEGEKDGPNVIVVELEFGVSVDETIGILSLSGGDNVDASVTYPRTSKAKRMRRIAKRYQRMIVRILQAVFNLTIIGSVPRSTSANVPSFFDVNVVAKAPRSLAFSSSYRSDARLDGNQRL
jgi:hypothetical protein